MHVRKRKGRKRKEMTNKETSCGGRVLYFIILSCFRFRPSSLSLSFSIQPPPPPFCCRLTHHHRPCLLSSFLYPPTLFRPL